MVRYAIGYAIAFVSTPSPEDLQQPFRQNRGRGGVLPGDEISVLHHVGLPNLAGAEVDADLFLEVGLEQPGHPGSEPDALLFLIGEARDPVALEGRNAVYSGGQHRRGTVAHDE